MATKIDFGLVGNRHRREHAVRNALFVCGVSVCFVSCLVYICIHTILISSKSICRYTSIYKLWIELPDKILCCLADILFQLDTPLNRKSFSTSFNSLSWVLRNAFNVDLERIESANAALVSIGMCGRGFLRAVSRASSRSNVRVCACVCLLILPVRCK